MCGIDCLWRRDDSSDLTGIDMYKLEGTCVPPTKHGDCHSVDRLPMVCVEYGKALNKKESMESINR